ncbi:MAG: long-chain fatty acid--CoA ligase [Calditrichaeota bacterium]|nr:long-chain fatty acid--CoA ligase [Calditrichota bacterium]
MKEYVVHQIIGRSLTTHPDQTIVSGNTRLTYEKFYLRVLRIASSLKKLGIGKGTVVGVLDVNTNRYLELHYALSMLGAILHTINFRLAPEQLVYTMIHAEDEWVFVSDTFMGAVQPLFQKFPKWVLMSDNPNDPLPEAETVHHYENLIAAGEEKELPEADHVKETDPFSIFYTTGTTGKPKGILYRHRNILLGALQLFHHLALHEGGARPSSSDVFMPLIPFFHIHAWGMAFFPIYVGAKVVLPGAADPAKQAALIQKESVTWLNMVPTQLHMLLDQPDFGHVKVLTGGSPLPSGLAKRADAADVQFSLIYGGSDQLGTAISVVPEGVPHDSPEALEWRRVGMRLLPMTDVSLRDKEGREVPHDGKSLGQVWVSSPWLPEGYYKNPEASQQAYVDGWFKTGDIGLFYPNGLLYVADREGDAVKSGGEWIPTGTLEAVLSEHPAVELVAVIPKPDERWGQRPLAVIKAREEVTVDALREFLKTKVDEGKIAKFWIPDHFEFVDEIPLTSAGKLNKAALREKYSNK